MQNALNWIAAKLWRRWFSCAYVMRDVRVFRDGNAWCALSGPNLQEGRAAFGATPRQALDAYVFDNSLLIWNRVLKTRRKVLEVVIMSILRQMTIILFVIGILSLVFPATHGALFIRWSIILAVVVLIAEVVTSRRV